MKKGFTLAEVLITLGIIGVVTAITMPILISNHQKIVTETRLKKFYSAFNQAIQHSVPDNGDFTGWEEYFANYSYDLKDENGKVMNVTERNDFIFKKYIASYMNIIEQKTVTDNQNEKRILYFLSDGSAFTYAATNIRDIIFFPKNAEKCLTQEVTDSSSICSFYFIFYPHSRNGAVAWKYHSNKGLEPYLYNWDGSLSSLYDDPSNGCRHNGNYCTALIQYNNWKIPKDFPRKFKY